MLNLMQNPYCDEHFLFCCLFNLNNFIYYQGDDPYFNKLIRILATRCMTQVISLKYEFFSNLIADGHFWNPVLYKWRQFTSIVETSVLQNINIMGLQLRCILISPLLFDDMQVWACLCCQFSDIVLLFWVLSHYFIADVIVHRLLAASLGIFKLPTLFLDRPKLTTIADSMKYTLHLSYLLWLGTLHNAISISTPNLLKKYHIYMLTLVLF